MQNSTAKDSRLTIRCDARAICSIKPALMRMSAFRSLFSRLPWLPEKIVQAQDTQCKCSGKTTQALI